MFEGYFSANSILQGRLHFNNGATFKGVITDNTRLVNGKYQEASWQYEGSFTNNQFEWLGNLSFQKDGVTYKYEGKFENGQFHGQGTLIVEREMGETPLKIKGTWNQGVLLNTIEASPN